MSIQLTFQRRNITFGQVENVVLGLITTARDEAQAAATAAAVEAASAAATVASALAVSEIVVRPLVGPADTVLLTDQNKLLTLDSATDVTLTIPNTLPAGLSLTWAQLDAPGLIEFVPADDVTVVVEDGLVLFSARPGASGSLIVLSNATGTAPTVLLTGALG